MEREFAPIVQPPSPVDGDDDWFGPARSPFVQLADNDGSLSDADTRNPLPGIDWGDGDNVDAALGDFAGGMFNAASRRSPPGEPRGEEVRGERGDPVEDESDTIGSSADVDKLLAALDDAASEEEAEGEGTAADGQAVDDAGSDPLDAPGALGAGAGGEGGHGGETVGAAQGEQAAAPGGDSEADGGAQAAPSQADSDTERGGNGGDPSPAARTLKSLDALAAGDGEGGARTVDRKAAGAGDVRLGEDVEEQSGDEDEGTEAGQDDADEPRGDEGASEDDQEVGEASSIDRRSAGTSALPTSPGEALTSARSSSGERLDGSLRQQLGSALGADLEGVRIHTGSASETAAKSINAHAYTEGQDIHFGSGKYAPGTKDGRHLIAHEVAHTVQQRGESGVGQAKARISQPGDAHEREADAFADAFVEGRKPPRVRPMGASRVQRQQAPNLPNSGPMRWRRRPSRGVRGRVKMGGRTITLGGNSLQLVDAAAVRASLRRGRLPTRIEYERRQRGSQFATTGDLVADAGDGSKINVGNRRWVKSAGSWQKYRDSYYPRRSAPNARKGVRIGGGPKVGEEIMRLRDAGLLKLGSRVLRPTNDQVAAIAGIARAESGGKVGMVWTADNMFVSMGFVQRTLGYGQIQDMMRVARLGFARHGLTLGSGNYRNVYRRHGTIADPSRATKIKVDGVVRSPVELRQPEYATRFYRACMEPDVIAAQVQVMLEKLRSANRKRRRHGQPRGGGGRGARFWLDRTVQTLIAEVENNRPGFLSSALRRARRAGVNNASTRLRFIRILGQAIRDEYRARGPRHAPLGRNIVRNIGTNVPVPRAPRRMPRRSRP